MRTFTRIADAMLTAPALLWAGPGARLGTGVVLRSRAW